MVGPDRALAEQSFYQMDLIRIGSRLGISKNGVCDGTMVARTEDWRIDFLGWRIWELKLCSRALGGCAIGFVNTRE